MLVGCSPSPSRWIDEAELHDGRIIHVHRSLSFTTVIGLSDGHLFDNLPAIYSLNATNPNTNEIISWQGSESFTHPIMLDFDGDTAYLVVLLPRDRASNSKYGCPWPPYLYFRHSPNKEWEAIKSTDMPTLLHSANLSPRYDQWYMNYELKLDDLHGDERERVARLPIYQKRGFQTKDFIKQRQLQIEKEGYYFQIEFPRNHGDWKFKQPNTNCQLVR